MSTHLSRHFERVRVARGLTASQLARLAGCPNVRRNGGRIREFELTGQVGEDLFGRIAAVLEIDRAEIDRLVEEDRTEFVERWRETVGEDYNTEMTLIEIAEAFLAVAKNDRDEELIMQLVNGKLSPNEDVFCRMAQDSHWKVWLSWRRLVGQT